MIKRHYFFSYKFATDKGYTAGTIILDKKSWLADPHGIFFHGNDKVKQIAKDKGFPDSYIEVVAFNRI